MNQTTTNDKYSLAERLKRVKKNSLDTFLHRSFVIYRVDYLAKQLLRIVRSVATHRHLSHPIYSVGVVENQ